MIQPQQRDPLTLEDWQILNLLQRNTFQYFIKEANLDNGLVKDNTDGSCCSIAATGMGLSAYIVGVERGFVSRPKAIEHTLNTLRFFYQSQQSRSPEASGYKGFYYHFLDFNTGRRALKSEISTMDTALLLSGVLSAAEYYDRPDPAEQEIRSLAELLYQRVDWQWALNGGQAVVHGWRPKRGFHKHRWTGYSEGLLIYLLGLGSPTHAIPSESYEAWLSTYSWSTRYNISLVFSPPLFVYQFPHLWVDFRGIQDAYMREKDLDYFENSRRAVLVQRAYAVDNPGKFRGYSEECWGISASDGPGPSRMMVDGIRRYFYGYKGRGVIDGPDDGTLAPWAVVTSLPFAPALIMRSIKNLNEYYPQMTNHYGYKCSFNPTYIKEDPDGWVSDRYYGIDQGPIVLMIENFRSEMLWNLMKKNSYLRAGLRKAGFTGGWLEETESTAL